ncbi:MAG TPA: PhzF family phenazine biosynthesis isomerase [Steroidobacteraceae bacterium]|nr:PhzF family phenazine biosynthesis isomerase [Steroidobacteraceae bacterium]
MTRSVRIFQVDAFTSTAFTGNPAGVVLDAEQLEESEMQAIARELNNGDTAFVLPAAGGDHDLVVRFFTPRKEAPFVGHATLAAHAVLSRIAPRPLRRQSGRTGIVEVRAMDDGSFSIRQPPPPLGGAPDALLLEEALQSLGLDPALLDPACPPRLAGSASTRLLLAVRDGTALDTLRPQFAALAALSPRIGAQGYFLFSRRARAAGCDTESRMFCPALGIDEDPVSGNAHAMLAMLLHEHGLLPGDGRSFAGAQGAPMRRPGRVDVNIDMDAAGKPAGVSIAGQAVVVFEATLSL